MGEKPPFWADILLTLWVVVVGVIYFGGFVIPAVGALTGNASAFYGLMVLTSAVMLAHKYLHREETNPERKKKASTKNGKQRP